MKRIAVSAGVLVALVAVAALAAGGAGATTQADTGNEANGSFGAEISSFMQASSAEAEGEVDDGMFGAAMNRTEDPEERRELVERRQERLQERQARLEERRSQISTDDGADVRDRALAVHVSVGASNLERSVNGTERAAQASGIDTESLNEIRTSARDLRGSEVAELARGIGGRSAGDRGPPTDVPGRNGSQAGERSANRSNGSGLPFEIGAGEPGNGSDPDSRDRDRGRSDDAGPPENEPENESAGTNDTGNESSRANSTGNGSSESNESGNDERADGGQGADGSGSDGSPNDERGNGQGGAQADSDDR